MKKSTGISLDSETFDKATEAAKQAGLKRSQWLAKIIEEKLEKKPYLSVSFSLENGTLGMMIIKNDHGVPDLSKFKPRRIPIFWIEITEGQKKILSQ